MDGRTEERSCKEQAGGRWFDGQTNGRTNFPTDRRQNERKTRRTDGWTDGRTDGWMDSSDGQMNGMSTGERTDGLTYRRADEDEWMNILTEEPTFLAVRTLVVLL